MGIVANIRGPAGANGVVGLFVAAFISGAWQVQKTNPLALSFNATTGVVTFLQGGWYSISNVNGGAITNHAALSTVTLAHANPVTIEGPFT